MSAGNAPPRRLEEARVVLHLRVKVAPKRKKAFLAFCRRAFPVYESVGGCRMVLYQDPENPGRFDEAGYYRSLKDYRRAEAAIKKDPVQAELIREWRGLLSAPPEVSVVRRRISGSREA